MEAAFAYPSPVVTSHQSQATAVCHRRQRVRGISWPLCAAAWRTRPSTTALPSRQEHALATGTWFKLICGASSHDLPRIRNLSLIYALLNVDCVDAAADPAVVSAVLAGFAAARAYRLRTEPDADPVSDPWLMVSVNDDEDPHFRKAVIPVASCPPACPRPCEAVCPADAIDLSSGAGVLADICYGCGRCIPVCPEGIVEAVSYVHTAQSIVDLVSSVDALEIHTQNGHDLEFERLWREIGETARSHLKLLAVSFPNPGSDEEVAAALQRMWGVVSPLPANVQLIWQTDGRPMSGDIGRGTAKASITLGSRVRNALRECGISGHVQLAGGTNNATAPLLAEAGLLHKSGEIAGVAIGGYARIVCLCHVDDSLMWTMPRG
jgi:Fe-S-cluster-containing hydrogenase component 2